MTGLESNGYYINNEIWLEFPSYVGNLYFTIRIENITVPQDIFIEKVYASPSGTARVNISPILKSMFGASNSNVFKITRILSSNGASISLERTFIRGGERSLFTNRNSANNIYLNPALKYPVFNGYPITFYYLNGDYTISQIPQADVPLSVIEYRNTRTCNGTYVKFLNQMGGYSYWYFESSSDNESSDNLGGFVRENLPNDLGNEVNNQIKAFSKFPKEYVMIAKDLAVSGDVYVFKNGQFQRCRNTKSSIEIDQNKRAYSMTFKFDIDYRFNPSLLWSN